MGIDPDEPPLKPIEQLKALVQMGIPFEQAYSQCWKDLRALETEPKPKKIILPENNEKK
tara:strand:+ start:154 stop:330 length:177 start_codon:yes stop_codon:yes gene_type:complete